MKTEVVKIVRLDTDSIAAIKALQAELHEIREHLQDVTQDVHEILHDAMVELLASLPEEDILDPPNAPRLAFPSVYDDVLRGL